MDPEDIPDEPAEPPPRRRGWPGPGPGRSGPPEWVLRRAYQLSLNRWGDPGGDPENRGIGSARWVQQQLKAEGHGDRPISTVQSWIKKGKVLREAELTWLLDPIHNREKITNQLHQVIGTVVDEYEGDEGIREQTEKLVTLLGGSKGLLALLADVTGAKAATALEITQRMPAGMSERTAATLRVTDPSALTDQERRDMRAAYDTRRRNGHAE